MNFDSRMVALALRLINKRGQTLVYTTTTQGAYNPVTGASSTTSASVTLKVLTEDYKKPADGMGFVQGLSMEGDKKITVSAGSIPFTPQPGDRVFFDGVNMTVQTVKQVSAGEQPVLYELRVRT